MKRNLRALALIFVVFAAFSFTGASIASADAHHNAAANGQANGHGHDTTTTAPQAGTTQTSNNQPQPYSNADLTGNGANPGSPGNANVYISTRDGSPSLNGNGNGKSVGKPCAGCVGNADNKNPPGQQPGGGDHNAGYECDRNHGIGQSNPAHTGCVTTTTVHTTTTVQTTTTEPPTTAAATNPPGTTTGGAGLTGSTEPSNGRPAAATGHNGSLAFTGFDSRWLALGSLALVAAGLLLYFASRVPALNGRTRRNGGT